MKTSDMARALGRKGGQARAARLGVAEKRRIAALGGRARALSLHAVQRVSENFRYVEAIAALRPRPKVVRLKDFDGTLPRVHGGPPQGR